MFILLWLLLGYATADFFEGDMLMSYEQIAGAYGPKVAGDARLRGDTTDWTKVTSGRKLAILSDPAKFWPYKTLYWDFENEGEYLGTEVQSIETFLEEMTEELGGTVQFVRWIGPSVSPDVVMLKKVSGSCASAVGRQGGEQPMYLDSNCLSRGVVWHEFMHALGFYHEHTRPDRDDYVNVIEGNIRSGKDHNFAKRASSDVDDRGSPYDYGSVMHYRHNAFGKDGLVTIIAPESIGQRAAMSFEDQLQINLVYRCDEPRTVGNFCTADCPCRLNEGNCTDSSGCVEWLDCFDNRCNTPAPTYAPTTLQPTVSPVTPYPTRSPTPQPTEGAPEEDSLFIKFFNVAFLQGDEPAAGKIAAYFLIVIMASFLLCVCIDFSYNQMYYYRLVVE
jgi:hypothetical protein